MSRSEILVVGSSALRERAGELLAHVERRARSGGEFTTLPQAGKAEFFLKGGPLDREAGRRAGLARRLLGRPPARLREYACFALVRAAGFAAPEAVLAAARVSRWRVRSQLLVTVRVEGAAGYEALLASPHALVRSEALDTLARTLGRFHARGLHHGDLFARNLVYRKRRGGGVETVFLDMWRGGRAAAGTDVARTGQMAARDLALLCTDLVAVTSADEQRRFFAAYTATFGDELARFDPRSFAEHLQRAYRAAVAHLERHPERRRGRASAPPLWRVPRPE